MCFYSVKKKKTLAIINKLRRTEKIIKILCEQMQMGQIDIADIKIVLDTCGEIPQLLCGLQHLYVNEKTRHEIFTVLKDMIPKHIDIKNRICGMDLWKILVLGVLRQNTG